MNKSFRHEHRVGFVETDTAGIVHFSRFLIWVEEAEAALWRFLGITDAFSVREGKLVGWPKLNISIRYRSPARFDDLVTVLLYPKKVGTTTICWEFKIERDGTLLAEGDMVIIYAATVPLSGVLEKQTIPEAWQEKLRGVGTQE
jgi:YbgC/YbaW family acyl-CoA thioester hydrolase